VVDDEDDTLVPVVAQPNHTISSHTNN
jgi:hypothetical protein